MAGRHQQQVGNFTSDAQLEALRRLGIIHSETARQMKKEAVNYVIQHPHLTEWPISSYQRIFVNEV